MIEDQEILKLLRKNYEQGQQGLMFLREIADNLQAERRALLELASSRRYVPLQLVIVLVVVFSVLLVYEKASHGGPALQINKEGISLESKTVLNAE